MCYNVCTVNDRGSYIEVIVKFDKCRGDAIRNRRCELNLSVTDAARKCNLAEKTWYRYEAGNPIRDDKVSSVLSVLKWKQFSSSTVLLSDTILSIDENHWAYSSWIENRYGTYYAKLLSYAFDTVFDNCRCAVIDLSNKPCGYHVGQIYFAYEDDLPIMYKMRYDYEFMCKLCRAIALFSIQVKKGRIVDLVIHELITHLLTIEIFNTLDMLSNEVSDISCMDDMRNINLFTTFFNHSDVKSFFDYSPTDVPGTDFEASYKSFALSTINVFDFDSWFGVR